MRGRRQGTARHTRARARGAGRVAAHPQLRRRVARPVAALPRVLWCLHACAPPTPASGAAAAAPPPAASTPHARGAQQERTGTHAARGATAAPRCHARLADGRLRSRTPNSRSMALPPGWRGTHPAGSAGRSAGRSVGRSGHDLTTLSDCLPDGLLVGGGVRRRRRRGAARPPSIPSARSRCGAAAAGRWPAGKRARRSGNRPRAPVIPQHKVPVFPFSPATLRETRGRPQAARAPNRRGSRQQNTLKILRFAVFLKNRRFFPSRFSVRRGCFPIDDFLRGEGTYSTGHGG